MSRSWQVYLRKKRGLIDHLCGLRGIERDELSPSYEKHLHDPSLLPDIEKACRLITKAREKNWRICVFGDYDADGTPAAALLSEVLKKLGISHDVELPKRESGYGLNEELAQRIAGRYQLLMTVDNGISAVEPIKILRAAGVEVIVLDHHLPKSELPPASALVDPFIDGAKYPFKHLCGCALAYKLAVALSRYFPQELPESSTKWLLDLVAVSTVADVMPIRGENRIMTYFGLKVLRHNRRLGLKHLLIQAGLAADNVDARALGYVIGPRLNASGRLGDNRPALELLLSRDETVAAKRAAEIERYNTKRKAQLEQLQAEVEALLWQQNSKDDRFLFVVGEGWPSGLVGLAAGKLVSQFYRPAVVGSLVNGFVKASGRSPETFSLKKALDTMSGDLINYGGHDYAAGLSFSHDATAKIAAHLKTLAFQQLSAEQLIPTIKADAILQPQEVSYEMAEQIAQIGPFGFENPEPLFILPDCRLSMVRTVGRSGDHLKATAEFGGQRLEAVGFGLYSRFKADGRSRTNWLATLNIDSWLGRPKLQLKLRDYLHDRSGIREID